MLETSWRRSGSASGAPAADEKIVLRELEKEGEQAKRAGGVETGGREEAAPAAGGERDGERENLEATRRSWTAGQGRRRGPSITFEQAKEIYTKNHLYDFLSFDIKNEKLYDRLLESGKRKTGKKVKFLDLLGGTIKLKAKSASGDGMSASARNPAASYPWSSSRPGGASVPTIFSPAY